jgi:hypothetical protein
MVSGSVVKRDGGKVGPQGSSERKPGAPMAPEAPLLGSALHKMERFSFLGRLPDRKYSDLGGAGCGYRRSYRRLSGRKWDGFVIGLDGRAATLCNFGFFKNKCRECERCRRPWWTKMDAFVLVGALVLGTWMVISARLSLFGSFHF